MAPASQASRIELGQAFGLKKRVNFPTCPVKTSLLPDG